MTEWSLFNFEHRNCREKPQLFVVSWLSR